MKLKLILAIMAAMFVSGTGTQAQTSPAKVLVVYYSYSGNTRAVAGQIAEATGADVFEIVPAKPYPADYQALVDQAKREISAGYRPALKTAPGDLENYDVIFIGSPNWWSTVAPPVASFLANYDLSGKTLVPFMTHGGGRMGHSVADIQKLCPGATLLEALAVSGSRAKNAENEVRTWLRKIKIVN